jgi:hypothetical protein
MHFQSVKVGCMRAVKKAALFLWIPTSPGKGFLPEATG